MRRTEGAKVPGIRQRTRQPLPGRWRGCEVLLQTREGGKCVGDFPAIGRLAAKNICGRSGCVNQPRRARSPSPARSIRLASLGPGTMKSAPAVPEAGRSAPSINFCSSANPSGSRYRSSAADADTVRTEAMPIPQTLKIQDQRRLHPPTACAEPGTPVADPRDATS